MNEEEIEVVPECNEIFNALFWIYYVVRISVGVQGGAIY
jgi:hypothetical protein